jgi:cytochrome P450/NADPH-cytochrome P450 reductase
MALLLQHMNFRLDDPSYELKVMQHLTIKPRDFYMRSTLRNGLTPTQLQEHLNSSTVSTSNENATDVASSAITTQSVNDMTIGFGTSCGTTQALAQRLAADAVKHGYKANVIDLDALVQALPTGQPVVIITSSYEGQPPDNATQFVGWLKTLNEEKILDGIKYAVFGCGHSMLLQSTSSSFCTNMYR